MSPRFTARPAPQLDVWEKMDRMIAAVPDWNRERPRRFWDPGRKLLLCIRRYQAWRDNRTLYARIFCKTLVLRHIFWSAITGADIPLNSDIGGGLLIPHPNGIVIHPEAKIGVNCLIFQQVTIGSRAGSGVPKIGNHVDIGAGAKILGALVIGNCAKIGANAVVLHDVSDGESCIGLSLKPGDRSIRQ